jgi:hypothetical protein
MYINIDYILEKILNFAYLISQAYNLQRIIIILLFSRF